MPEQLRLRSEGVPFNNIGFDGNDCAPKLIENGPIFRSIQIFGGFMDKHNCSVCVLPGIE
jgi:hypothetical protein